MDALKTLIPLLVVSLLCPPLSRTHAAEPQLDFKEVLTLIQSQLDDLNPADLDTAAARGLIASLHPRVRLIEKEAPATHNESDASHPARVSTQTFDKHFGYIRIHQFLPGTGKETLTALTTLTSENPLKGLVLDLRFATGDDYASAAQIADRFFETETDLIDWGQGTRKATIKTNAIHLPLVIIVNRETAEGAEALAGVLRLAGSGLLVGSNTSGQANMYREFELSTGQKLHLATSPVLIADNLPMPTTGLDPDIAVTSNPERELAWLEDPYKSFQKAPASNLAEAETAAGSGAGAGTLQSGRRRINEADLVRMLRDGELPDAESAANGPGRGPGRSMIQDPALNRALDFLKGLAVVRPLPTP